jgi:hypothetical protein
VFPQSKKQQCAYCKTTDMPCVTPFRTSLYPNKVFCSATCITQLWEDESGCPYKVQISSISTLDSVNKEKLFTVSRHKCLVSPASPRGVINHIKKMDEQLGERFRERKLFDDLKIQLVQLSYVHRNSNAGGPINSMHTGCLTSDRDRYS